MTTADAPSYTLDSHEMRCLSVLKPMAFLMAVEYDIFLAATHAGQQPLEVQFPTVSQELKKALLLCASRFHLLTRDEDKKIIVHGVAALPLLRYVDFLPGQLHLDEVLSVANIKFTKTEPKRADKSFTDSKYAFVAAAIDYDTIGAEEPKFEAVSFFLTIDAGLPLASMGHLLRFEVPPTSTSSDAVKSFQRFSHWNKFDLRWDDEETKLAGVIVLPSTTDVHDLFERYEDEDTGDDATLLFRLRPIGACAHVPYLEDALLRRIREQAWKDVLSMWEASAHARAGLPTVTISGFSTTTSVDELLHVIDKSSVVDATLVVEDVPSKRRKLYVNLNSAEAVRVLLGQDGYRASQLSGKPNLRISVSPPYFADSRRGHVIMTVGMQGTRSPSPQPEFADPADGVNGRGGKKQAAGKKDSPQPSKTNSRSPQAHPSTPPITTGPQNGKSPSTTPPLRAAEAPLPASSKSKGKAAPANATDAKTRSPQASSTRPAPASADSGATNGKAAPAPKPSTSPQRHPASKSTAAAPAANAAPKTASEPRGMDRTDTADSTDAPLERQLTATPSDPPKSKLNKAAAPFVPSGSPLQTFAPPPPPPPPPPSQPPPYAVAAPGQAGLPPPPYVPPPPTYLQTTSPLSHMVPHNPAVMPPAYSLSPPVYASMPPPYSKTPGGRPAPPPYIPTPTSSMGSPIGSEPNLPPPSSHE